MYNVYVCMYEYILYIGSNKLAHKMTQRKLYKPYVLCCKLTNWPYNTVYM